MARNFAAPTCLAAVVMALLVTSVWRPCNAKSLYMRACIGDDDQRWQFRTGPFVHHTLIHLINAPDWCLVYDILSDNGNSSASPVYADVCDVPQPTPQDFQARIWILNENKTIQTSDGGMCLAVVPDGLSSNITLMSCAQLHKGPQSQYASFLTWNWNDTGLLEANGTSPPHCMSVNMTSPTPPHPRPSGDFYNVLTAKCDTTDRLQEWSGLPSEANGTIHHQANTSYCLAARGSYPGVHGPNSVIAPCNTSDPTQIYVYSNTSHRICTKAKMSCSSLNSTQESCCVNVAHTTDTPQAGNDIELYTAMDMSTEDWVYDTPSKHLIAAGLCMTIQK